MTFLGQECLFAKYFIGVNRFVQPTVVNFIVYAVHSVHQTVPSNPQV